MRNAAWNEAGARAALCALAIACALALAGIAVPRAHADELAAATPASRIVDLPDIEFKGADLPANAGLPEGDARFAGYVERAFGVGGDQGAFSSLLVLKTTRGSRLVGQEKIVYDKLADRIRAVAAGDEPSTIVSIPLEDLGVKKSYTAEDLGLESVFSAEDPTQVSDEARMAVNAQFNVALLRVLNAVLSDFPYELYWYDKTEGIAFEPPDISSFDNGAGGAIVFAKPYVARFKMRVSGDYSAGGLLRTYMADTAKTRAASLAAANAEGIVAAHAAEGDYDKLHSYMEEVAKLTDYDYTAADVYEQTGVYGDPWQVVDVFDGDPDTKVVCEGYAKAFQYLCDMSSFQNGSIACNSVSGDMYGGTGSGPHMWNVVALDGANYLVDVTNNDNHPDVSRPDAELFTPNDELFMAGAEGSVAEGYLIEWPKVESNAATGDASTGVAGRSAASADGAGQGDASADGAGQDGGDAAQGDEPEGNWMYYAYDEDTIRFFDEDELALSQTAYRPGESDAPGDDTPAGTDGGNSGTGGNGNSSGTGSGNSGTSAQQPSSDAGSSASAAAKQAAKNKAKAQNAAKAIAKLPAAADVTDKNAKAVKAARKKYDALTKAQKALVSASALKKLKAAEKVVATTLTLDKARVSASAVAKACKKAAKKPASIKKVVLGAKVKTVSARAFKKLKKATKLVVCTKKLKKNSVKGALAKSKVKTVQVKVGSKKANKTYVKKYKSLFAKKNSGRTVKVKA